LRVQAGAAVDTPRRGGIPHEDRRSGNGMNEGNRQQDDERFRQPGEKLSRNVGYRQRAGRYLPAPMRKFKRHRDGREMEERNLELLEWIADQN
jgi:hypothetical protein